MDISVRTETSQVEDRSWLASAHGTEATASIVLDVSAFTAATHLPNGYIPSGVALGRISATGLYGPYNNTLGNGQEVCAGFLFSAVAVAGGTGGPDVAGALLEHGSVRESRLPANHGLDAAGKTDLAGRFTFR